jgi:hypothetical protein
MDGDNGRKLRKKSKPYTETASLVRGRLAQFQIPLHVLERYGIENYFPKAAYETVLGKNLAEYFPMPHDVPCDDHFVERPTRSRLLRAIRKIIRFITRKRQRSFYRKGLNEGVAAAMSTADIASTDLERIVTEIVGKIEEMRKY